MFVWLLISQTIIDLFISYAKQNVSIIINVMLGIKYFFIDKRYL